VGDSRSDAGDGGTAGVLAMGGTAGTVTTGGTSGTNATGATGGLDNTCLYWGQTHPDEVEFVAPDGCNTCVCHYAFIECTLVECTPVGDCEELRTAYDWALEIAKYCPPDCNEVVLSAPQCGCPTHAASVPGLYQLDHIALAYAERGCIDPMTCPPCPDAPVRGYCSTHGYCIEVPAE
jgi:hypothetical protein